MTSVDTAATLPDETPAGDAALFLGLALDYEQEWSRLQEELRREDAMSRFLAYTVAEAPFYRSMVVAQPLHLDAFSPVGRDAFNQTPEHFLARSLPIEDAHLAADTNGTIAAKLRVRFDRAAWFEFSYGTFSVVAVRIPGLTDRTFPGEPGVFLINNCLYQRRMSVYIPPLGLALLRQLVLERSREEDEDVVRLLRARNIPLLYGKPSTLLLLADVDACLAGNERIRPFAILVSGEALYADQRRELENRFDSTVYNAYVATEGGLIAMECSRHCGLHLRDEFVYAEVVGEDGAIRQEGSGDIVITTLFNRGHLFVRYRLGDWVEISRVECACGFTGRTITTLRAREANRFVLPCGEIAAKTFERFLASLPLREFQVDQIGEERPTLKWVARDPSVSGVLHVQHAIERWLRDNGWLQWIEAVPMDAVTPRGGKHRRFVRLPRG